MRQHLLILLSEPSSASPVARSGVDASKAVRSVGTLVAHRRQRRRL